MAKLKSVCVVGAGPSGLVAAKTLIHDNPNLFEVTVFEQSHRIGGLWPVSKVDDGLVNPAMCTNQSRHTVSFSDLAWSETAPQFPKAWQVGEYLQRYISTYPGYDIQTNCKVLKTERQENKWKVHVVDHASAVPVSQILEYDHLIIATGFFGKAKIPRLLEGFQAPIWHSSQLRGLNDLLTKNGKESPRPGKRILVVGGQMSGVEIAANIAFQLSSASNSVGGSSMPNISEYSVTHVVQQPFWVMPFLLPRNPVVEIQTESGEAQKKPNNSPLFLPLDLVTYNLAVRPAGPVQNTSGHITTEAAKKTHEFMNTFLGNDQSEYGSEHIAMTGEIRSQPPYLAVSDQYNEFVRAKKINIIRGKVIGVSNTSPDSIVVQDISGEQNIDGIASVVFATGFDATSSIDFLPEDVLKDLDFDPRGDKFPLAPNMNGCASKAVPSLGFVGFYRSPYWGVMEMQARFLGKLWSADSKAAEALAEDKTKDSLLKLRNNPRGAQFPMGDYAYLMESFSEILGIKRTEPEATPGNTRTGLVLPSRYLYDTANDSQRQQALSAISIIDKALVESKEQGRFVPRAIFKSMQGDWKLERVIESRRSDYPSGTLLGTAQFNPRAPTDDAFDMEYLYLEKGEFVSTQGFRFTATRNYAYRYCELSDTLSAWFVKPKDNKSVDYLFHELELIIPPEGSNPTGRKPWFAKSAHLCIKDMYNVKYQFRFRGASLDSWIQEYTVNGPAKDYTIKNSYRRP